MSTLPRTDMHILGGLRLGGGGSRALWRLGRGTLLGGTDLEDVPLDCGNLLFQLFPFPFCPICVYVCACTRLCVCIYIYNNIYMFACLLEDCGSGKGAGTGTRFPLCI